VTDYELARRCYTVLLYCCDTLSTAVPTRPLSELRDAFSSSERRPSAAALAKLAPDQLYTTRVRCGDALVLSCAVPHKGKANPDAATRYVCFLHFSPAGMPLPDTEQQRYPHGVAD
jgi:hypothetical protein